MSSAPRHWSKKSLAAQALGHVDPITKAVVPPIHVATTYIRDPDNQYSSGYVYGRPDNATVREAEAVIAMLEEAEAGALLFSSGMAAATAVFGALDPGDHIVAPTVMYWALRRWLTEEATRWGLKVDFVATDDLDALKAAVRPGQTKLVWLETPSNPLWTVTDIAGAAEIAHAAGARLAVDSTASSPVVTRPLSLGADVVMHAATKVLNGHSDVIAGALAGARADEFWARIQRIRSGNGAILGPFEAYLLMRGMRTLHVRIATQMANAAELAQRLSAHPAVAQVLYPGLATHPGHAVAARQMTGFGTMLSIRVAGGEAAAIATAARVALWKRATSLGGVESLIEHRASIEGPTTPCPPDLLRLSVGIEDVDDLFADLDQALRQD
ncbi:MULTISPECIES: aminotransferase class V-fold PLP-dependent enzyme [Methylobacterium]|jgi:cystathionine gamma-synthase|uniref:trans-sulfuration enzyme family protein n=1 Tax=Methylobacterium TaxID=407 RepID=UPI0008E45A8D|nr:MULTISPECIES: aminotransferase class V-fold PLP-dependent enzyme [Methylobacterium]MBZ6411697.1 aminotransferase class V-fold PLP-dependent enzyme [Methylobacterium sp.]MBK3400307.1 aminotransferase class V-fold PLP-dependent enzyme [Methylobacterium ajmalii]MBK3411837.1 aminotransferase class V-fold PLP-dependent enzyme [Methylobacterium ajmalii]MBK3420498.1 aminotransferase class V-fold PLP-dependent enzyme [Methylobacterium ajmalii]SFE43624.1 cystathionine gamma-synthase [Methylobacteriu